MAQVSSRSAAREPGTVIKEDDVDLDLAAKELGKGAPAFNARGEFRSRMNGALPRSISSMQIRRPARRGSAVLLVICLLTLGLAYATYLGLRSAPDTVHAPNETEVKNSQPTAAADTVASDVQNEEPDAAELEKQVASAPNLDEEPSPTIAVPNPLELRKGPIAARQKRSVETVESDPRTNKESARPAADRPQKRTASTQPPRRVATPVFEQPRVSSIEAIMTGVPSDQRQRWVDEDYIRLQEERRQRRLRRIREARRNGYPF